MHWTITNISSIPIPEMSGIKHDVRFTIMGGCWYCYNENMLKRSSNGRRVTNQFQGLDFVSKIIRSEKIMKMSWAVRHPGLSGSLSRTFA